jgi:hypothetical protein
MSETAGGLPIVMTQAGAQPQSPTDLRAQLDALVQTAAPGYTSRLPGSLIEDLASTVVYAISLCDAARVESINSLTPYGANAFILNQLGAQYGIPQGLQTNTSVFVVFACTDLGVIIQPGTIVGDGANQYTVMDGGTIGTGGVSLPIFCIANNPGSFAVPANTVNQLVTDYPDVTVTVNNPEAGTPGGAAQTTQDYRAQVLQQIKAAAQGMPTYLRAMLELIPGVQARLVSIRQVTGSPGWQILCGGGDNYQVAGAIYFAVPDFSILVGSTIAVAGVTNANPAVITTVLNHGLVSAESTTIAGVVGTTGVNGTFPATVLTEKTFSIPVNTTSSGTYTSGGIVTPNARNITTTLQDASDSYTIPYVNPPPQSINISLTWNTSAVNFVSDDSVASLGSQALQNYVNSIVAGQPMNLFELQNTFQLAIAPILPTNLLTRMVFAVSINGVGVAPSTGTGIIAGDPESYFLATSASVQITRG